MSLRDLAYSPGARALGVALRTGHIAAMALLAGGLWFDAPRDALQGALALTVATGALLTVSEMSHSRHWVYQGRGLFVLAHLAAAAIAVHAPTIYTRRASLVAILLGSVGSHLPRTVRKWSLRHGRVIE